MKLSDAVMTHVTRLMRMEMREQEAAVVALHEAGVPLSWITILTWQGEPGWAVRVAPPGGTPEETPG